MQTMLHTAWSWSVHNVCTFIKKSDRDGVSIQNRCLKAWLQEVISYKAQLHEIPQHAKDDEVDSIGYELIYLKRRDEPMKSIGFWCVWRRTWPVVQFGGVAARKQADPSERTWLPGT